MIPWLYKDEYYIIDCCIKDKISIKVDEETTIEFVPGMGSFNPDMLVEKLSISQYVSN